jgi:hypothetical protein
MRGNCSESSRSRCESPLGYLRGASNGHPGRMLRRPFDLGSSHTVLEGRLEQGQDNEHLIRVRQTMETRKRVLIAVDTSSHALNAVRYVAVQSLCSNLEVRLFSILSLGDDEVLRGVMVDEEFLRRMKERYRLYALNCRRETEEFLEQCRKILAGQGFPESRIDVCVRQRRKGISSRRRGRATMP